MAVTRWFETGSCSLIGDRSINQDRLAIFRSGDLILLILADGMGGHPRGDRAAEIVIETCQDYFDATARPIPDPKRFLIRMLHKAHERITLFGFQQSPSIEPRSTVVAALIQNGILFRAHAGDSRLYLLREQRLHHRTTDDSYIELLRKQGVTTSQLRENSAKRHYVTKCLGGSLSLPIITPDEEPVQSGDLLVLCSDGFWSQVAEREGLDLLYREENLRMTTNRMAHEAVQAAPGESDNVSLITMRITAHPCGAADRSSQFRPNNDESIDLSTAVSTLEAAIKIANSREK